VSFGKGRDDDGGGQLRTPRDPWQQAAAGEDIGGLRSLAIAGLHQQVAAGCEPSGRSRSHPPLDIQAVNAAVERQPWLVQARLRRHHRDRLGGNVGRVGDQDVYPAAQPRGQRFEQVPFVHLTRSGDVAPGASHRSGVDVRGVQLDPVHGPSGRDQRHTYRARAAAQVNDDRPWRHERGGLAGEELGAAAGHEHSGVHGDPQAAELRPAKDVFQRQAGDSSVHHGGQVGRRPCGGDEQPRLVLGEDAAGGP